MTRWSIRQSLRNAFRKSGMSFAHVAATADGEQTSRIALSPTLSPRERGNFSGVAARRMGVDAPEPFRSNRASSQAGSNRSRPAFDPYSNLTPRYTATFEPVAMKADFGADASVGAKRSP